MLERNQHSEVDRILSSSSPDDKLFENFSSKKFPVIEVPKLVFNAYLKGTLRWPQLRGGANIHILAKLTELGILFDEVNWQLSQSQLRRSVNSMSFSHGEGGIRLVDNLLVEKDWYKAQSIACSSIQSAVRFGGEIASGFGAIALEAREILESMSVESRLFILSFYAPPKREILISDLNHNLDSFQDSWSLRKSICKIVGQKLQDSLLPRFPRESVDLIIGDFLM